MIENGDIVFVKRKCGWFIFLKTFISKKNKTVWWRPLAENKRPYSGHRWPHNLYDEDNPEIITHIELDENGNGIITLSVDKAIHDFLISKKFNRIRTFYEIKNKIKYRYNWTSEKLERIS